MVAADEPNATVVGRDVLTAGGTAADATVAMYFTLAVTLPSTGGLGGGGVCLAFDRKTGRVEGLEFLPRPAPGARAAVPGNVRGMAALHARLGRLRWEQLVAPAENMARFGATISKAAAVEIATGEEIVRADPAMAQMFSRADGKLLDAGDQLRLVELSAVLGQIRQYGAGTFYTGSLARQISNSARAVHLPLPIEALRDYLPHWQDPIEVPFGDHMLSFAAPPPAGGTVAAEIWMMLTEAGDWRGASAEERPHLFAEASTRAFADRVAWVPGGAEAAHDAASADHAKALFSGYDPARTQAVAATAEVPPESPWATSIAVADREGDAVACSFTLNNLFGAGRMAPGTGIVLAPALDENAFRYRSLGPVMMTNQPTGEFHFAAAAAGGVTGPSALVEVMLQALVAGQPLKQAVAEPRVHRGGDEGFLWYETGASDERLEGLRRRGHQLQETGLVGRVVAIRCRNGLPQDEPQCEAATDPRVPGLALVIGE